MVFQKKLIDEINSVPDEMIYGDESVKAKEKDSFVLEANKNPEKPNESQKYGTCKRNDGRS